MYSENELLPAFGPAQGKGDAMRRSLSVARGDIVMFADADTKNFDDHFIYGTLGPLLAVPGLQFSKAAYRRPFTDGQQSVIDGGGRVTELMAKPLAQVDLGARQNRHQSLWDLTLMSSVVLRAMTRRARGPQRGAIGPGNPRVRPLRPSDTYLHAVATEHGLRLDEHLNVLLERPSLANVLAADQDQDTVA